MQPTTRPGRPTTMSPIPASPARLSLLASAALVPVLLLAGCAGVEGDPGATPTVAGDSPTPAPDEAPSTPTSTLTGTPAPGAYPEFAPSDYAYTLTLTCYCPDAGVPMRVTVRDDEVVAAVYARGGGRGGAVAGEDVPLSRAATLDEVVAAANTTDAYRVEVVWPAGQDHPDSVAVDRSRATVDEEIGYQVADVVVGEDAG